MDPTRLHRAPAATVWELLASQHGVISRGQLRERGYNRDAIRHRIVRGRLRLVLPEVYAAAPGCLSDKGRLMAAALSCGTGSAVSHWSAAFLWGIFPKLLRPIEVTIPASRRLHRPQLRVHRTRRAASYEPTDDGPASSLPDFGIRQGIPLTSVPRTLLDLATVAPERRIERLVNEADKLGLISVDVLRDALDTRTGEPGVRPLRRLLDRDTFRLTDSELERIFMRIVRRAGLPMPQTGRDVNGYVVDLRARLATSRETALTCSPA